MELTSVKTIACLVPTNVTDEPSYTSASFKPHKFDTMQHGNEYQLMVRVDEQQTRTWKFDDGMTLNTMESLNKERADLVDFTIKGYDVACLSLSVSHGSRRTMYDKRKQNLELIFTALKDKLKASNIIIQYAYVGITDESCYDLRKESPRSNEYMFEKGIDSLMKKVDNVDEIWTVVEPGSTLPFILTIKLTNESQKTIGRLVLIDLLSPRFSPLMQNVNDKAHYSFLKLCDAVRAITDNDYHGHLATSSFLTHELSKYITGHNKLTIFGYINDAMINDLHSRETTLCLDFITSLRKMPVRMMPNKLVESTVEYRCLVAQKAKVEKYNEKLQKHVGDLKAHTSNLKSIIASLQSEKETKQQELIDIRKSFEDIHQSKLEQIKLLEAVIADHEQLHAKEILKLKAEAVVRNTMLDLEMYTVEDMQLENEQAEEYNTQHLLDIRQSYEQQLSDSQERHAKLQENLEELERLIAEMKERIHVLETEGLDRRGKQELETQLKHALEEQKNHELNALKKERDLRELMKQVPMQMQNFMKEYEIKQDKIIADCKAKITSIKTKLRESKTAYEIKIKQLQDELNVKRRGLTSVQDNSVQVFKSKTPDVPQPKKKRKIARDEDENDDDDDVFETPPPRPPSVKSRKKGKKPSNEVHVEVLESDDEGDKRYRANAKRSTRSITPMYNGKAHLEVTDTDNEEQLNQDNDKENKFDPPSSSQPIKRKRGRPPTKQKKQADPPTTEDMEEHRDIEEEPNQDNGKENKVESPSSPKRKRGRAPTKQKEEMDPSKTEDKQEHTKNEEDNDKESKVESPSSPQSTKRKRGKAQAKLKKQIDPSKTQDEDVEMPPTIPDEDFSIDNHTEIILPDFSIPHIDISESSQPTNEATPSEPTKQDTAADDDDDDSAVRSPVLGATTPTKPSKPPAASSSQSSQPGRRKRKLRNTSQSQNMTEHLHDTSQMSPLSQFIKKSEKFLP